MSDLDTGSKTAWLLEDFVRLVDRVRKARGAMHFDVLVTGDGATFLRVRRGGAGWEFDREFGDGAVQTLTI